MMTEIQTIDGGQRDALLRRANLKKKKKKPFDPDGLKFELDLIIDRLSSLTIDLFTLDFTNWATYRQEEGKFLPEDIDSQLCTHIVYGFAVLNPKTLLIRAHDSWIDFDKGKIQEFQFIKINFILKNYWGLFINCIT